MLGESRVFEKNVHKLVNAQNDPREEKKDKPILERNSLNERYVERERERERERGRGRQEGEGRERGIDIGPNSPQLLFQIIRNTLTNTSIIGSIVMEFCITSVYVTLIFSLCTTLVTVIGTVSGYNVTQLVIYLF